MHLIEADQGEGVQLLQSNAAPLGQLMMPWHDQHQLIMCIWRHLRENPDSTSEQLHRNLVLYPNDAVGCKYGCDM